MAKYSSDKPSMLEQVVYYIGQVRQCDHDIRARHVDYEEVASISHLLIFVPVHSSENHTIPYKTHYHHSGVKNSKKYFAKTNFDFNNRSCISRGIPKRHCAHMWRVVKSH